LEGFSPVIPLAHGPLAASSQRLDELVGEKPFALALFLEALEDLIIRDPARPSRKIGARLVLLELLPEHEVGLLQNVLRIVRVVQ
jgi:hypothetical protein